MLINSSFYEKIGVIVVGESYCIGTCTMYMLYLFKT